MNSNEVENKHAEIILANGEIQRLRPHEQPAAIARIVREQLGIVPIDTDIADMDEHTRREVLTVMGGVRDCLLRQKTINTQQAVNLTDDVNPDRISYFAR